MNYYKCRITQWYLKSQTTSEFLLVWIRPGGAAGSHTEEGSGRSAGQQLEPPGDKPEPSAGQGRHSDRWRWGDGLVHRLLAEGEGEAARGGEGVGGREGPNGEDPLFTLHLFIQAFLLVVLEVFDE